MHLQDLRVRGAVLPLTPLLRHCFTDLLKYCTTKNLFKYDKNYIYLLKSQFPPVEHDCVRLLRKLKQSPK